MVCVTLAAVNCLGEMLETGKCTYCLIIRKGKITMIQMFDIKFKLTCLGVQCFPKIIII